MEIFQMVRPPAEELFFKRHDPNDLRLGEIIPLSRYEEAGIIILGCPQDEGVRRNKGRLGSALAPDKIREQFYKLTNFGISSKIFDLGNVIIGDTLEETHDRHCEVVSQILKDGKSAIILGGGNDISYPDGKAMSDTYGREWLAINIDAHFDVRADEIRNSGTPYRQLLDEAMLKPAYFYEVGYQSQANSPAYYEFLNNIGANLISLEQLRSQESVDISLRDMLKDRFIKQSSSLNIFFGFDLDAVRASDAPGVSASSPIGLRAGEFLTLVNLASSLVNTKIIEFSEVNPNFDIDNRTAKLVAIAMHRFCSGR